MASRAFPAMVGLYTRCQICLSLAARLPPVVVYQMGKVGSSTLTASLKAALRPRPVFKVHGLRQRTLREFYSVYEKGRQLAACRTAHLWRARTLSPYLGKGNVRWKFISLVREPIARNLSEFFQSGQLRTEDFNTLCAQNNVAALTEQYLRRYSAEVDCFDWFEEEMRPVIGIDVLAFPFDPRRGYRVYRGEWVDLLVVRLESLSSCVQEAFREFLGVKNLRLRDRNVANGKEYRGAYRSFVDGVEFTDSYLDSVYSSKRVRHFYSGEEISSFKKRWAKGRHAISTEEELQYDVDA